MSKLPTGLNPPAQNLSAPNDGPLRGRDGMRLLESLDSDTDALPVGDDRQHWARRVARQERRGDRSDCRGGVPSDPDGSYKLALP